MNPLRFLSTADILTFLIIPIPPPTPRRFRRMKGLILLAPPPIQPASDRGAQSTSTV